MTLACWALWFARNKLVHEGVKQTTHDIVVFVQGYLVEIKSVEEFNFPKSVPLEMHWRPPHLGYVKINFDSSFNLQEMKSLKYLSNRKKGFIMAVSTHLPENIADTFIAEVRACEQAIHFAEEVGYVWIEGDSLTIMNANTKDNSIISSILVDIKRKLGYFDSILFLHVKIYVNMAAHTLAKGHHFAEVRF